MSGKVERFEFCDSYACGMRELGDDEPDGFVRHSDYAALEARNAGLEGDRARLDFLAENTSCCKPNFVCSEYRVILEFFEKGENLREAIDAAIEREGK